MNSMMKRTTLVLALSTVFLVGCNGGGSSTPSADTSAPMFLSGSLSSNTVSLRFNENLNTQAPPVSSFNVTIDGSAQTPTAVSVSGTNVTLTLPASVLCANSAQIRYTAPTSQALADAAGNKAASFGNDALVIAANTNTAAITYTPNAGTTFGSSDTSAAFALDPFYMVVGDDEWNVLRVYPRTGGAAVSEWDYGLDLPIGNDEMDFESMTRLGNTLYFMSSLSNKSSGATDPNRAYLIKATVSGTGNTTQFTDVANRGDLKTQLVNWDKNDEHGLGANYFGFAASTTAGVAPEQVSGFSIEGMAISPDDQYLWLGFRAPQVNTTQRNKALIVPVKLDTLMTAATIAPTDTTTTLTFGAPIQLNLGGRGIRSISRATDGSGYLIIAGPAGAASTAVTNDFRLYTWDGNPADAPIARNTALDPLRNTTGGSFESSVSPSSLAATACVQLLQDDGDTIWPGQTQASKKLAPADQQFVGNVVQVGSVFTQTSAPFVAASTPSNGASNMLPNSPIVLQFDRGIVAGTGNIELHLASDNSLVQSFDVSTANQANSSVTVAYNTLNLKPSNPLAYDTAYYLTASSGSILDNHNNTWAGFSGTSGFAFTTAAKVNYSLIISEVNSNATPSDFFEIYNYGTTAVDLSNWRWSDSAARFTDSSDGVFASGTQIPAGGVLVVETGSTDDASFRLAWGLTNSVATAVSTVGAGPGLGKGDAVVLFDANGQVAAYMNYGATAPTASDGSTIPSATRADNQALSAEQHAGLAVGGSSATVSAVWNDSSTSSPAYQGAVVGTLGGFAQPSNAANIGSPGVVH